MASREVQGVIVTNQARCRDCYRCVRVCPVKAIRVEHNQASVDASRCLNCGTCVRECPQGAKSYRRDRQKVEELLRTRAFTALSLAPAFAGAFEPWEYLRLPAALRQLGFSYVAETAVGAHWVAQATAEAMAAPDAPRGRICTACPASVAYVEMYRPDLVGGLLSLVSPMTAHARHVKAMHGPEAAFVFVGPCTAKKAEASRPEVAPWVDAVLTFEELLEWLADAGLDLSRVEESAFDELPGPGARLFPVEGGQLAAAALASGAGDARHLQVSGFGAVKEAFACASGEGAPLLIEPLMCPQGCINGPGLGREGNVYRRRQRVISYARGRGTNPASVCGADIAADYRARPLPKGPSVTENDIRLVLEQTGRARPENQLNCGACGYASCRDQAEAVLLGMAEREMCIPYMRRLAEQRSNRIMETSPNAIVVLDRGLNVHDANPAFEKLFRVQGPLGLPISHFIDPEPFERLASGQTEMVDGPCPGENAPNARLIAYPLSNEERYVAIFVSQGDPTEDARRLRRLKQETVVQAQELNTQQVEMARQMAVFLGEHTAKAERLVARLIEAVKSDAPGA